MRNLLSRFLIIGVALFLMITGVSAVSVAQTIDYKSMQELFGEPVTTSANGSAQRQSDVPINMDIITAEDIRRSGARSIPELLRSVPGLSVRQSTYGQTEVAIRGYNHYYSERVLVLLDGRQVYTDYFGQVVWDNIPVEIHDIQQIEIIKGPNTALFGFNAAAGVVNIITSNPLYDDVTKLDVRAGTQGLHEISGTKSFNIKDKVATKVSVGAFEASREFEGFTGVSEKSTQRSSFISDTWVQITDKIQGHFEVSHNENRRNDYVMTNASSITKYDADSVRGNLIAETNIGLLDADVYYNEIRTNFIFPTAPLEANNRITVAKLSDTFKWGTDHVLRISGEYRDSSHIFETPDNADLTAETWSVSGLWDWSITSKLRSSAAIRYDDFTLSPDGDVRATFSPYALSDFYQDREELSYNLGLVYKQSSLDTYRLTVSRGAIIPSFTDFGVQFFAAASAQVPVNRILLGNPYTPTSIVDNYELNYERQLHDIEGWLKASVFYQTTDDVQAFNARIENAGANQRAYMDSMGDSTMYGFDLSLEGRWGQGWNWLANYSFVTIDDDLRNFGQNPDNPDVYSSNINHEAENSEHSLNLGLGFSADRWHAQGVLSYVSGYDALESVPATSNQYRFVAVDDSVVLSGNFIWHISDNVEWSLSGTNLLGKTNQSFVSDAETMVWSTLRFEF